jgi:hypothetical protein
MRLLPSGRDLLASARIGWCSSYCGELIRAADSFPPPTSIDARHGHRSEGTWPTGPPPPRDAHFLGGDVYAQNKDPARPRRVPIQVRSPHGGRDRDVAVRPQRCRLPPRPVQLQLRRRARRRRARGNRGPPPDPLWHGHQLTIQPNSDNYVLDISIGTSALDAENALGTEEIVTLESAPYSAPAEHASRCVSCRCAAPLPIEPVTTLAAIALNHGHTVQLQPAAEGLEVTVTIVPARDEAFDCPPDHAQMDTSAVERAMRQVRFVKASRRSASGSSGVSFRGSGSRKQRGRPSFVGTGCRALHLLSWWS